MTRLYMHDEDCWVVWCEVDGIVYVITENEMDAHDHVLSGPYSTLALARGWGTPQRIHTQVWDMEWLTPTMSPLPLELDAPF